MALQAANPGWVTGQMTAHKSHADLRIPSPVIASVPLLVTYAAGHGVTDVVLPRVFGLRELFGATSTCGVVHLGECRMRLFQLLPCLDSTARSQALSITCTCRCCRLSAQTASISSPV